MIMTLTIMLDKSESRIQQECFDWFWNTYCTPLRSPREIIFHVPNENQHRLTNIGVVSGMSDLVATYRGRMLFIEVKTPLGKQSIKQQGIEKHVGEVSGAEYHVVRSLEDFKNLIRAHEVQNAIFDS
jgi:hypothetical protein